MANSLGSRLKNAWNTFRNQDDNDYDFQGTYITGGSYSSDPSRTRSFITSERTIISAIYTRIAIDFASVAIRHVKNDSSGRFEEYAKSGLDTCLSVSANVDQTGRAFRQNIATSLFENGTIAIVPVDTSTNPNDSGSFDILTMRVGKVTQWRPRHVTVNLYNDRTGMFQEVTLPKNKVAIVENPLYSVMNEPNSTLQRLIRKLSLLDSADEQASSGKLDLIIQLPYVVKNEARKAQAKQRREDIEVQLKGSKYGIAYTDGTEKITQLNRPAENNLLTQIEYLTEKLYSELGITAEVINGTANEQTMLNYYNRTIKPLLDSVTESLAMAFLTKTATSQGQAIRYFRDAFALVPISQIAEIADKFTRNEVLSSNEVRFIIGYPPVKEAKADQLLNKNMPVKDVVDGEHPIPSTNEPPGNSPS